jgi:CheY-like chemotaxis protein/HPt (histidine-containing phosphotransfer) domain-containing protein
MQRRPALRQVAIVLLAPAPDPGLAARARDAGVAAILAKPVKHSELLDTLLNLVSPGSRTTQRPRAAVAARPDARPLRILVAEDNAVNQRLTARLLEKRGHEVVLAGSGQEALAALEREPVDVILMDVRMPRMDGLEATAAIRTRERSTGAHVPIVALTADAMRGDRERCLAAGMDAYVTKPIRGSELMAAIRKLVPAAREASGRRALPAAAGDAFDRAALLDRVDGDEQLLREVAGIFLDDCPALMAAVDAAIEAVDPGRLTDAAHKLAGAIGNFAATRAMQAARAVEARGRAGTLEGVAADRARLGEEVELLRQALTRLVKGG